MLRDIYLWDIMVYKYIRICVNWSVCLNTFPKLSPKCLIKAIQKSGQIICIQRVDALKLWLNFRYLNCALSTASADNKRLERVAKYEYAVWDRNRKRVQEWH